MGCCNCKFLEENNVKNGNVSGCSYYCKKCNCYVTGNSNGCDKFSYNYCRNSYIADNIYYNGTKYYDDDTPVSFYLFILFILLLLLIVKSLF